MAQPTIATHLTLAQADALCYLAMTREEAQTIPALAWFCNRSAPERGGRRVELAPLPEQLAGCDSRRSSCRPAVQIDTVFGPVMQGRCAMRDNVIGA